MTSLASSIRASGSGDSKVSDSDKDGKASDAQKGAETKRSQVFAVHTHVDFRGFGGGSSGVKIEAVYPTEVAARRHCLLSNVLFYSEYEGDPATHLASVRKFLGDSFSFAFTDQNSESKEAPKQAGGGGRSPAGLSQMERSALRAAIVRLADSAVAGLYARSVQVQTDLLHDGSRVSYSEVIAATLEPSFGLLCGACSAHGERNPTCREC